LWNYQSDYHRFEITQTLRPTKGDIYSIAFHPTVPVLAIGCERGVRLYKKDRETWDDPTVRGYTEIEQIDYPVYSVAFKGAYLFFGGESDIQRFVVKSWLWDTTKLERDQSAHVNVLINNDDKDHSQENAVKCIALYPKAGIPIMVTGSTNGNVKVWWLTFTNYETSLGAQNMYTIYRNLKSEIKCIVFHPTEPYLAIGYDNKVGIFTFECSSRLSPKLSITNFPIYTCETGEVVSLAFSASPSRMLAIATQSQNVVLLDYITFRDVLRDECRVRMKQLADNPSHLSIPASKVQKTKNQCIEMMRSVSEKTIVVLPPNLPTNVGGKSRNKRKAKRKRYTKKQRGRR
jgi:WD40 repeat protein